MFRKLTFYDYMDSTNVSSESEEISIRLIKNTIKSTYTTHSMLQSWAATLSLMPLSSRFQRISEERNRICPDGSGSFMWRQIVSAPRASRINAQFKSVVVKWNVIKEMLLMTKQPTDLLTLTQGHLKSLLMTDCYFVEMKHVLVGWLLYIKKQVIS